MLAPPPPSPPPAGAGDAAVLASARLLQRADPGSDTESLLRGKNLGLVCDSETGADAILFREAAAALGASVSHIRPELAPPGGATGNGPLRAARVLGRLYDGIECQGLVPALVRQLARAAGVPVFDGLATAAHPSARLAQELPGDDPLETKRRLIVQAMLLIELR
jgi:ornithine carbamoyltransferase